MLNNDIPANLRFHSADQIIFKSAPNQQEFTQVVSLAWASMAEAFHKVVWSVEWTNKQVIELTHGARRTHAVGWGFRLRGAVSPTFVPSLWMNVRQFANGVCILIPFCFSLTLSSLLHTPITYKFVYMYAIIRVCVNACICELRHTRF